MKKPDYDYSECGCCGRRNLSEDEQTYNKKYGVCKLCDGENQEDNWAWNELEDTD